MERLEGWEGRMSAVIQQASEQPYVLGVHDCFKMACDDVCALTGVDLWAPWAGTYATPRQALARIAEYGKTFDGAFSRLFGSEPVHVMRARRGDIMKYVENGVPHLGVCVGRMVAVLAEHGLVYVFRTDCQACWRIG